MKKSLFLWVITVLLLASCKKEERVFEQTADERLNEALTNYSSVLTGSAAGWNAVIQPALGGTFHFFFQFNDQNRVFMFSDFDTTTAKQKGESSYRLKALQQPSLIFDTYSYLHILSDPDASKNGGTYGAGLLSDFEFAFESVSEDSVVLVGRINKTRLKLERASQADLDAWQNGQWYNNLNFLNLLKIQQYFKRLTLNGVEYEVRVNPVARTVTFEWLSGGNLQQFTSVYYFSGSGVILENPLVNGSQTIAGFSNVSWNSNTEVLTLTSGSLTGNIKGFTQPLRTDLGAPLRWWQTSVTADTYWISFNGFHSNGTDDAFNINSLSRYYYFIYWAGYGNGNDLIAPIFLNQAGNGLELLYGAAPATPTFTGDGKAIFNLLGYYGTYPTTGPAALSNNQFYIPEGYYFVQLDDTNFDMVAANGAKTWISWTLAQ